MLRLQLIAVGKLAVFKNCVACVKIKLFLSGAKRGVEMLRVGIIAGLLLLVVMYGAKERPAIRPPYYVQYQMNKVERQAVRLEGSILKIFTKERSS